jgi:hypothetical protein
MLAYSLNLCSEGDSIFALFDKLLGDPLVSQVHSVALAIPQLEWIHRLVN